MAIREITTNGKVKTSRRKLPAVNEKQLEVTTEYEVFSRLPGNRQISEAHVKSLMNAMRQNDLFVPILVNDNFEVVDGQHRLEARKRLGLPVPYYWTSGLGLEEVQKLNSTQQGWKNEDYMKSYIELGIKDYEVYKWFRDKYGLPHRASFWLLTGGDSRQMKNIFQSGSMKVMDLEGAKKRADMLLAVGKYFTEWKDSSFIRALFIALNREGFDFKTFLHRVAGNTALLRRCASTDQYLQLIEEAFNYRAVKKVPIRFGEDIKKYRTGEVTV